MSQIFRLGTGGSTTGQDWHDSQAFPYNSQNLATIDDEQGVKARHEITSIPSPFARIDLVKTAFAEVARMAHVGADGRMEGLDGDTIFHKMVADTLDVGEIFFNIDKLRDQVEILTWDSHADLEQLLASPSPGQRYFGDALRKYMQSDHAYNFDRLQNIYILNYKRGPGQLNVVGATSPATLFFSNANDLSYINDIQFGQYRAFHAPYQPLYRRDRKYIRAWFALMHSIAGFSSLFPEVADYLDKTFQAIADADEKLTLRSVKATSPGFDTIVAHTATGVSKVEVIGFTLLKNSTEMERGVSEFEIRPTKDVATRPLVLPNEDGLLYAPLFYTTDQWGRQNHAPNTDPVPLAERLLPQDGTRYPYLTVGDLLEDWLVSVPHWMDTNFCLDCMDENAKTGRVSYLLPLRPAFFDYFSAADLLSDQPGTPSLRLVPLNGGSVQATLSIPIVGNKQVVSVEYSRVYYGGGNKPNPEANRGGIAEMSLDAFIMPAVRFNEPAQAVYTVGLVSTYDRHYTLELYDEAKLQAPSCCRNQNFSGQYKSLTCQVAGHNIDYMRIGEADRSGVLVPRLPQQVEADSFKVAIDLGTSNTHIELSDSRNATPVPLVEEQGSPIVQEFFRQSFIAGLNGERIADDLILERELIEKEFVPRAIGGKADFAFPTRTAIYYSVATDWKSNLFPYGMTNPAMTYNKREILPFDRTDTDIKWGRADGRNLMQRYIESLMLMVRNKVILSQGILADTQVVWFYPLSMPQKRLVAMREVWDDTFHRYFNANGATESMTESDAPIKYYFSKYATAANLVNIDIGGETTDVAFARDKQVEFATSFRFGANALFEDSLAEANSANGLIDHYGPVFRQLLAERKDNRMEELISVYDANLHSPANMAMFLFSLKDNSWLAGLDRSTTDFDRMLRRDEDFKIVFILFYAAIIYHVAGIVRLQGLEAPRHIAFSGNGSKVLSILSPDPTVIAEFTKRIFEQVLGKPYGQELTILGLDAGSDPKESTCKGGLIGSGQPNADRSRQIIMKATGDRLLGKDDTYGRVDTAYLEATEGAVESFFNQILGPIGQQFDYDSYFGVSPMSLTIAKEECHRDLLTYLRRGLDRMRQETEGGDSMDETLFFYPIKGVLHSLEGRIYESMK